MHTFTFTLFQQALCEAGVCEALCALLRSRPGSLDTQLAALLAVNALCSGCRRARRRLGAAGLCTLLSGAMQAWPAHSSLQRTACLLVSNLVRNVRAAWEGDAGAVGSSSSNSNSFSGGLSGGSSSSAAYSDSAWSPNNEVSSSTSHLCMLLRYLTATLRAIAS
jgi:hypothetical protein